MSEHSNAGIEPDLSNSNVWMFEWLQQDEARDPQGTGGALGQALQGDSVKYMYRDIDI